MNNFIAVIFSSLLLASCASNLNTSNSTSNISTAPVMREKAAEVLPSLYGKYTVIDSRLNYKKIDTIEFSPINGKPTLKMFTAEGKELAETVEAYDCAGYNHYMTDKTLFKSVSCSNKFIGSRKPAMIDIEYVEKNKTVSSGSMIKAFDSMVIENGYYLEYNSGDSRMNSHFSLKKTP